METPAIIFDLDGTLIDSAPDLQAIASHILLGANCAPLTREETRSFIGNGAGVFVERMCLSRGIAQADQKRHLNSFLTAYETAYELTVLYPGVLSSLKTLSEAGHPLGMCTNKPMKATRAVLSHLQIINFFTTIVAGDTLDVRKPDPKPLNYAKEQLGQSCAFYVGDSEVDAETAKRSDTAFLLFTNGYRKSPINEIPHHRNFDSFTELPMLLQGLLNED